MYKSEFYRQAEKARKQARNIVLMSLALILFFTVVVLIVS
jgi:hypothetical protein